MAEKHPIRNGIIVGVVVLAVGGIANLTWPFLPRAVRWLGQAVGAIWAYFMAPMAIPRLIVAVIVIVSVISLISRFRRNTASSFAHVDSPPAAQPLSELQQAVLTALVLADGKPIAYEDLPYHVKANNLRITEALDALLERNLIEAQQNIIHGTQVVLSRRGRRLAIESRLA